jgi:hypothetical protein
MDVLQMVPWLRAPRAKEARRSEDLQAMIEDRTRTLDDLIAECQAMTTKRLEAKYQERRPPPPMQSFVSGPPKWLFWLFAMLVVFAGGAWIWVTVALIGAVIGASK